MREEVYGTYAPDTDITFIMTDYYMGEELIQTRVVGFVYGNEVDNMDVLMQFNGNLMAIFV